MIERDEFHAAIRTIREDIGGVHARLDKLNGRTREMEIAHAVTRSDVEDLQDQKRGLWGWFAAAGLVLVEFVLHKWKP